ncbi:MAG: hypothetical protein ACTHM6_14730 [Tepidisphaeraceae bacterium]
MITPRPSTAPLRRAAACAIAGALAVGCQQPREVTQAHRAVNDYFNGDFPTAIRKLEPLANNTDENYVLNNLRLGSTALVSYDLPDAEAAFLKAWEVINAGGVNSGARSAAAVVVDEKLKIWKGEPYERAMASFYLGLVYLVQNDLNNARASFENSLFKLRDYASDKDEKAGYTEQESSFVLADILLGRCWLRLNRPDLAQQSFDRAIKYRPDLASLANAQTQAQSNVLLVVDYGYGPRKVRDNDGTTLRFVPDPITAGPIPRPTVFVDGAVYPTDDTTLPTIDTIAMAQQRRWQSIDTIRVTKDVLGTGLIAGGAGYGLYRANQRNFRLEDAAIAGGLIAAGALLRAGSDVDVRQWEMLPRTVFLVPLRLPPGVHDITVSFPIVGGLQQTWQGLAVPSQGDATYYFRMNRWLPGPFVWPPAAVAKISSPAGP